MRIKYLQRPFEVKEVRDNGTFAGYGAIFNTKDSYRDIIMPGAFAETLKTDFVAKNRKVPMLWQHDRRQPIGVYSAVKEDTIGLFVEGELNMDVQQGKEAFSLMKQGALTGLSIGYVTVMDKWLDDDLVRELHEVKLYEISPVTFPAHDDSRINSVKSIEGFTTLSDCEQALRDAGWSRTEAKAFIAKARQLGTSRRDGDDTAASIKRALDALRS